jgi:hypothetical protein
MVLPAAWNAGIAPEPHWHSGRVLTTFGKCFPDKNTCFPDKICP